MYLIQYAAFLVLLQHQCFVNGFNIFDIVIGSNYLNREIDSATSSLSSNEEITTRWINQELDHFNSSDKRKWQMKYLEGLRYWRENGPIYLFLEEFAISFWLETGIMHHLAKETHGAMFVTEHRFYGKWKPVIDIDAENIQYLSSRQALADIAKLIYNLKSLPMYKDSKVVVIGSAYGGNLAAWMKVLYPKLIDAALSSSAPVLAQKEFYEYLEQVKQDYVHYGGTECLNNIEKKFENYDLLLQSPEGINQLKLEDNICNACDMAVIENQQLFFFLKTSLFMDVSTNSPISIPYHCEHLDADFIPFPYPSYRRVLSEHSNGSEHLPCKNYDFNHTINDIQDLRNYGSSYPKIYQICNEFGNFPTTSSNNQPFLNIPLEFYIKICSRLFGNNFNEKRVDKGVEMTNKLYGGLKPNVTKVVFTNGDMDPHSKISILEDLSEDAQAVVIPGYSRSAELFVDLPSNVIDVELDEALTYVKSLIKKWIGARDHSK